LVIRVYIQFVDHCKYLGHFIIITILLYIFHCIEQSNCTCMYADIMVCVCQT